MSFEKEESYINMTDKETKENESFIDSRSHTQMQMQMQMKQPLESTSSSSSSSSSPKIITAKEPEVCTLQHLDSERMESTTTDGDGDGDGDEAHDANGNEKDASCVAGEAENPIDENVDFEQHENENLNEKDDEVDRMVPKQLDFLTQHSQIHADDDGNFDDDDDGDGDDAPEANSPIREISEIDTDSVLSTSISASANASISDGMAQNRNNISITPSESKSQEIPASPTDEDTDYLKQQQVKVEAMVAQNHHDSDVLTYENISMPLQSPPLAAVHQQPAPPKQPIQYSHPQQQQIHPLSPQPTVPVSIFPEQTQSLRGSHHSQNVPLSISDVNVTNPLNHGHGHFMSPSATAPAASTNNNNAPSSGIHSRNSFLDMTNGHGQHGYSVNAAPAPPPMLTHPNQHQHIIMSQQVQQIQQQLQQQMQQQLQQHIEQQQRHQQQYSQRMHAGMNNHSSSSHATSPSTQRNQQESRNQPMRRKMKLHLVEKIEVRDNNHDSHPATIGDSGGGIDTIKRSIFSFGKGRSTSIGNDHSSSDLQYDALVDPTAITPQRQGQGRGERLARLQDHGEITVAWYNGTSAVELKEHVKKSIEIKLRLGRKKLLLDLHVIDESVEPHEEIVLSPHMPDGSKFLLTFRIKDLTLKHHYLRAPPSPSAAPSPPGELEQELQRQISDVLADSRGKGQIRDDDGRKRKYRGTRNANTNLNTLSKLEMPDITVTSRSSPKNTGNGAGYDSVKSDSSREELTQNEILSQRLEKLNETILLLHDDGGWAAKEARDVKTEKKQVIFVIANYFVLFLSLIAISAELHERAPSWINWMNENVTIVQNCAADKDELFKCVSEGNFSGLVASVILWASQSVATKRFFLFGFDSPQKLWTVVYECGITSICWGTSYLAIRRGLNPDTRPNCLRKYWKDAVYGSLSGFNAAFMKAVLKNLLPKADEILDVMEHRQTRIFNFLSRAIKKEVGEL